MIIMKMRAVLIDSLHWATLAVVSAGWLFIAPLCWETLRFVVTEPGGGEFLLSMTGLLLLAARWTRRRDGAAGDVRTPQEKLHIARHEAAHAVVAWALGVEVMEISTQAIENSGGHVQLAPATERPVPEEAWKFLQVSLAGAIVEDRDRQQELGACGADLFQALEHASTIIATGRCPMGFEGQLTVESLIGAATEEARVFIDQHPRLLEAVTERVAGGVSWAWPDLTTLERETRSAELVTA